MATIAFHLGTLTDSFITPFAKWSYTRALQGFLSFGDGYNNSFDGVLSKFVRKERCVGDTIHYDDQLEEYWLKTIDVFIITMGSADILLNPDKFQFCQRRLNSQVFVFQKAA